MIKNKTKENRRAELLFWLFGLLLVLSFLVIMIVNPLGNKAPAFERNIYNNITTFAGMLFIVSMELMTIFYFKKKLQISEITGSLN